MRSNEYPKGQPAQAQSKQPGNESEMIPRPYTNNPEYLPAGKLEGKNALITGGDSGIGKATAIAYAKEGAHVAIVYLNEHEDAQEVQREIEEYGGECLLIPGDVSDEQFASAAVSKTIEAFGALDILVNNAAEQHPQERFEDITNEQMRQTFATNIFSFFYFTHAALPHLSPGSVIINTTSITAYKGSKNLIDYSATKGAITSFTRSLSQQLIDRGIRVNGVAPGPIWTPLIPATFKAEDVAKFGANTPMKRAGQPEELAPSYVFLACEDSSYMTGQVLHLNGGAVING
ncbi:SDR family oxidoreductase [Aureibacillus halotolerans]|uniref:NAD(P)-dependent dehydrogenase (Short-subunit alcohol dehydrogenase family) n=1 Tax=Aureibacillus halotolerans TaxID=1508390 RepID=A0A4R6UG28_9BACI|nr:SDR family oxidoreductase [Aureibacillus halotolerans]TDQ42094.1 NAD(P)-dependent dehydrogenase (short-subunit alcohol dehydrogenase family) [Aureibacillus halotolerans]